MDKGKKTKPIFALCDFVNIGIDAPVRMKAYKKYGLTHASPNWGLMFYENLEKGDDRFRLFDIAQQNGIKLDVVHLDKNVKFMWLDDPKGDKYCDFIIECISECVGRGIKAGVFHPYQSLAEHIIPDLPKDQIGLMRLRRIVKHCEKVGFVLAVENLFSNEYLDYIFENIESENLKMCLDTGHANITNNLFELFEKYKDKIYCTHIHNNYGINDDHSFIDDGIIDMKRFLKLESNIKYHILEVFPRNINNAEDYEKYVEKNVLSIKQFQ